MKRTILIIEDEEPIADTLIFSLERDGFLPLWKSTGMDALETLRKETVDFVILDLGLPDMDGFELLKVIRKESRLPVMILSARSEDVDRIVGLEVGADDFVTKPFSPREIGARVRAILRRFEEMPFAGNPTPLPSENRNEPAPATPDHSDFPFQIDEQKKTIRYCDTPLALSRYEYEILALLIRRPGWVFSREKIMELIWEEPEESFDRVVDTHIKNIRMKLKKINDLEDPIQTRRGIGYSLKENL